MSVQKKLKIVTLFRCPHFTPRKKNENHKITNFISSLTQSHSGYRAFAAGYNGWPEPRDLDGLNSDGEDNDDDNDEDNDDDEPINVKPFCRPFNDNDDNDEDDNQDDDVSSVSTDVHLEQDSP